MFNISNICLYYICSAMTIPDYMGIYGGLMSTLVLIWRIWDKKTERKSNVGIDLYLVAKLSLNDDESVRSFTRAFALDVINQGYLEIHVNKPKLELLEVSTKKKAKFTLETNPPYYREYPMSLRPSAVLRLEYSFDEIHEFINNSGYRGKILIRALVVDSRKNTHHSKWFDSSNRTATIIRG